MNLLQPRDIHAPHYKDTHLTVEFESEAVYLDGARLKLTHKSHCLLAFLVQHPGELIPREMLLSSVWGYSAEIRTRTLDVHIRRLRKSLGRYGNTYIETIFGVGYRFQPIQAQARQNTVAVPPVVEQRPQWKMAGSAAF
jgi:DNA-binding response OmpR family regulator